MSCPINSMAFVAIKMGRRQGGPSRTGSNEGAYLDRYVTDDSNAAAGPFSSQPSGPWPVSCFSALLTPYVSIQICSSLVPVRLAPP